MSDIKRRYKELARKHHPDVGGDEEKIRAINGAYALLMEYLQNYRFGFSDEEILKQFPTEAYYKKFNF